MDPDTKNIVKSGAKVIENASDIFHKLAGPLAEELGLFFGEKVRDYRVRNWVNVMRRTKAMLNNADIEPTAVPSRLFLPIVQAASVEDSEILQEKWAALIANSAGPDRKKNVMPSFIEVLKQMTPDHARLLDGIYQKLELDRPSLRMADGEMEPGRQIGSFVTLTQLLYGDIPRFAESTDPNISLIVDDLIRLRIIQQGAIPRAVAPVSSSLGPAKSAKPAGKVEYYVTPYGLAFLAACHPPKASRLGK